MNPIRWICLLALSVSACAAGPEPIRWGTDTCDECRMVLSDPRFGAELIDRQPLKFDGLDELGLYLKNHPSQGAIYVTAADTGALIPLEAAVLLASRDLHGPMGGQVIAFTTRQAAEAYAAREGLGSLRWPTRAEALAQAMEGGLYARH